MDFGEEKPASEHPQAQHFAPRMSVMALTFMSQKQSTSMSKGRKIRSVEENRTVAPAPMATEKAALQRAMNAPYKGGKKMALILRFKPKSDVFLADVGLAAISVFKNSAGMWVAELLLKRREGVWSPSTTTEIIPAHTETVYSSALACNLSNRQVIEIALSDQVFVPEKRVVTELPKQGGHFKPVFSGKPEHHPARAVRTLANMEAWFYYENQCRSLTWLYRSLIIEGFGVEQKLPKKDYVMGLRSAKAMGLNGCWSWEIDKTQKVALPTPVTLPNNAGMTRTPKLADIRSEMSYNQIEVGSYSGDATRKIGGKRVVKANQPPRYVKYRRR